MRFEGYECYKDSGIEWLDTIPTEWEMRRIKEIFSIAEGQVNPLVEPYKSMILIAPNHIEKNTGKIIYTEISSEQGAISGKYYVHSGELIYSKIRPALNKICKIDFDCLCSADMYPLKVNNQSNNSYYMQVFLCIDFVNYVSADSSRVAMPKVNRDSLRLYRFPFPPLKTQQKIAIYLDKQTQKIDKEINLLEQKIEKYKELKQTLINETVLRGLDKGVELKDSGIEWIGEIPKNWEVKRLKDLGVIETSSVNKKNNDKESFIKLVNYTDVYKSINKELINDDGYMKTTANSLQIREKKLKKGDVLFTPSSETIEDIAISAVVLENLENTLYSYHLLRLRFSVKFDDIFKKYLFNNHTVQYYFSKSAKGTTRKILGLNYFYNLKMPIPPLQEQTQIANYLDEKTQKIDNITQTISKKIELLKEFRKTLVNDMVTGRVKV